MLKSFLLANHDAPESAIDGRREKMTPLALRLVSSGDSKKYSVLTATIRAKRSKYHEK